MEKVQYLHKYLVFQLSFVAFAYFLSDILLQMLIVTAALIFNAFPILKQQFLLQNAVADLSNVINLFTHGILKLFFLHLVQLLLQQKLVFGIVLLILMVKHCFQRVVIVPII